MKSRLETFQLSGQGLLPISFLLLGSAPCSEDLSLKDDTKTERVVLGHIQFVGIATDPTAAIIESVVIHSDARRSGLGRIYWF